MFSYIGYILLISICPMLKIGKLHSIARSAILTNLFKNYLKGAKIGGFLLNCKEIPLIVL